MKRAVWLAVAGALALTTGTGSAAPSAPPVGVDMSCYAPAGDPAPGTAAWEQRDALNQYCASLRNRDQAASPAFGFGVLGQGSTLYAEQAVEQLSDPTEPRGGITTLVPGSRAADPFRTIKRWTEAGRGRVAPVAFTAHNGSTLRGHVFVPPASVPRPAHGYPGVVITDGSVQGYQELYYWAAEDLAEAGYMVLTYDVQGEGSSDLLGADCPGACTGVPYQQDLNFFQGAEDSLSFLLSTKRAPYGGSYNPWFTDLDASRVALAGHSLGASAVSEVGQCDRRVRTIVAWDNLSAVQGCAGVAIPARYRTKKLINVPALAMTNDYAFNTQPTASVPDPAGKTAGYRQVAAAGLDAQLVALRGATHLTYTYIPLVLQANELGERMASYYTKAWLDLHLRGDVSGFTRLTARVFDASVDVSSIGAGVYDPSRADPADPYSGNTPYRIKGIRVANAMSFYYPSEYSLRDPRTGRTARCTSMRKGCP